MQVSDRNLINDHRQGHTSLEHSTNSRPGKAAIVTGASSGVGRAVSQGLGTVCGIWRGYKPQYRADINDAPPALPPHRWQYRVGHAHYFDQNALEPDAGLKEYDKARTDARALVQDVMPTADLPEAVVLAATAARPRRRYPTGKIARQISMLRRLVPAEMFDKSLRRQMRLPV
jgi:NAD(P)-dependent dehydrogenase (short-subunit alcohol dehydrogenase family)